MANKNRILNRSYIMQIAQSFSVPFTAKDVSAKIDAEGNHLGLTTIYRILNEFVDDGLLHKTLGEGNTATYRHLENCTNESHIYLECRGCHRVFHVDCRHFANLRKHIARKHRFDISNYQMTIPGYCAECQGAHE